jgi:hypothetical protein
MPDYDPYSSLNYSQYFMQISSLYSATRALFIGSAYIDSDGILQDNMMGQPSFLEILPNSSSTYPLFVWGDVLKGVEEMSHNVTAAILTLELGNISSDCFFDQQTVIFQYSSFALWVPYGVRHFSFTLSYDLILFFIMFYRQP